MTSGLFAPSRVFAGLARLLQYRRHTEFGSTSEYQRVIKRQFTLRHRTQFYADVGRFLADPIERRISTLGALFQRFLRIESHACYSHAFQYLSSMRSI
jgi:hypothetical protein